MYDDDQFHPSILQWLAILMFAGICGALAFHRMDADQWYIYYGAGFAAGGVIAGLLGGWCGYRLGGRNAFAGVIFTFLTLFGCFLAYIAMVNRLDHYVEDQKIIGQLGEQVHALCQQKASIANTKKIRDLRVERVQLAMKWEDKNERHHSEASLVYYTQMAEKVIAILRAHAKIAKVFKHRSPLNPASLDEDIAAFDQYVAAMEDYIDFLESTDQFYRDHLRKSGVDEAWIDKRLKLMCRHVRASEARRCRRERETIIVISKFLRRFRDNPDEWEYRSDIGKFIFKSKEFEQQYWDDIKTMEELIKNEVRSF
ncbi:hypothetical protein JXA32_01620 [Candidatus Sumerlaeota bacterium]|nr:hypothetical protein [Candidatus Sumerlaeota bacterium]